MAAGSKFYSKAKCKRGGAPCDNGEIFNIPPYLICPSPLLPRTEFRDTSLCSLADSIRRYGILQPLCVCLSKDGKYELVAGERRLRAAVLLRLPTVPCVLVGNVGRDAEYLSVIENVQREGLNMFDEARAIKRLMQRDKISESKAAELLSIGEAELCEKLSLTRFSRAEMQEILNLGMSSGIAVLFLDVPGSVRYYAIKLCAEKGFSQSIVRYLCSALSAMENPSPDDLEAILSPMLSKNETPFCSVPQPQETERWKKSKQKVVLHDLRSFEVAVRKSCDVLHRAGLSASFDKEENENETVYTVKVKKNIKEH